MSFAVASRAGWAPRRWSLRPLLGMSSWLGLAALLAWAGIVVTQPGPTDTSLYAGTAPIDPARQTAWLAAGTVPPVPELGDSTLVRDELRDLYALSQPYGVPVAGWSPSWRYVWPRDSALAAAAFARTGHPQDAERVLAFLEQVQPPSGVFQARYLPDGSGVPDSRGTQLDGSGWALWALGQVAAALPAEQGRQLVGRHRTLLDRSTTAALTAIDNPDALPPPSPDYWEVSERRPTLATAALLRAGLQNAARLYESVGDRPTEQVADAAADRLSAAIAQRFRPDGYPRRLGGGPDSVDLGVAFLLPPFGDRVDPAAVRAWQHGAQVMARPAGGLAPGGSWRLDGVSWTTATSSYALTAAALGDRAEAVRRLRWLDSHRTPSGSLPEKVTAAGEPAAVAPLAWAAATVILSADHLRG